MGMFGPADPSAFLESQNDSDPHIRNFLIGLLSSNPLSMGADAAAHVAKELYGDHQDPEGTERDFDQKGIPGTSAWTIDKLGGQEGTATTLGGLFSPFQPPIGAVEEGATKLGMLGGKRGAERLGAETPLTTRGTDIPLSSSGPTARDAIKDLPAFEFSDAPAKLTTPITANTKFLPASSVLDHPELYKAYPEVKNTMIIPMDADKAAKRLSNDGDFASKGALRRQINQDGTASYAIYVNPNMSEAEQRSTVLHEIQHQIQYMEGHLGGSGVDQAHSTAMEMLAAYDAMPAGKQALAARNLKEAFGIDPKWLDTEREMAKRPGIGGLKADSLTGHIYLSNPGEVNARLTQLRSYLTPEQLKAIPRPATDPTYRARVGRSYKPTDEEQFHDVMNSSTMWEPPFESSI